MSTAPETLMRTSPIAPTSVNDALHGVGIADVTLSPRAGAKGADTPAWCVRAHVPLPDAPNTAVRHDGGGLVARLAPGEVLLLGAPGASAAPWIDAAMADLGAGGGGTGGGDAGLCFPLPRADSHAWFVVAGRDAAAMFAKVCGVDLRLRAFEDLSIAQTSVARINAIVIRDDALGGLRTDKADTPCYHVLADWASARSLWAYLCDAMEEFGGGPVHLDALAGTKG